MMLDFGIGRIITEEEMERMALTPPTTRAVSTIRLTALRQLTGDYGTVMEGGIFYADPDIALALESRGLASRHVAPEVDVEQLLAQLRVKMMRGEDNKMVSPSEFKVCADDPVQANVVQRRGPGRTRKPRD